MIPSKWSYLDWVALVFNKTFDDIMDIACKDDPTVEAEIARHGGELSKDCNDRLAYHLLIQPVDLRYLYEILRDHRDGMGENIPSTLTVVARWHQMAMRHHENEKSYWFIPRSPFQDFWTS